MIKKVTAVVADIDGTLLPKGKEMLPRMREALEDLHKKGILFGVASGRPLDRRIKAKAQEWGLSFDFDMMIGMNGGDLWVEGMEDIQHNYILDTDTMKEIMSWLKHLDMNAISYIHGYDEVWALRMDQFMADSQTRNKSIVKIVDPDTFCSVPTGKIEVHYPLDKEEEIMAEVAKHPSDKYLCVHTYMGTIEFLDKRVNKGMGLKKYAEYVNIPVEEIMTFGDMENDYELIRDGGWGVCMINGCDECKAVADDITELPDEECGMAEYLYKYVL
ncbi:MAG: HAD family phosphatase [Erysipelotrichaceae bacterium]|nr:HAD family phosphatase [Erysipelotrichaceae bacterium]